MLDSPLSKAERALSVATTPKQSKNVEAMAAAAKAWAKEQNDFEMTFKAALIYIQARCKTTELVVPTIRDSSAGRPANKGNDTVTVLADYGFTKMQWNRRKKELEASKKLDFYQDDCIVKGVIPTPHGLVGFALHDSALYSSDSNEWNTPKNIIDCVLEVMDYIDLDPCSNYGEPNIPATWHYNEYDDGLNRQWGGKVYMNPPYGREIADWVAKLVDEYERGKVTEAIALVPSRTDTEWFRQLREYPRCFIWGRLKFSGSDTGATFPSMAVYFGGERQRFLSVFGVIGDVYELLQFQE